MKDKQLGDRIFEIEERDITPAESLSLIKQLIETSYTLPTKSLATEKERNPN